MVNNFTLLEKIEEIFQDYDFTTVFDFDDAVIGIDESQMRLIYSVNKCVEILQRDMSREEALEYLDYNILNEFKGDKSPIFCFDIFTE